MSVTVSFRSHQPRQPTVLAYLALPSTRQVLGCAHDSATVPGKIILLVFLLVEMDFPIIEVDFLKQASLMADPANSRLVSAQNTKASFFVQLFASC